MKKKRQKTPKSLRIRYVFMNRLATPRPKQLCSVFTYVQQEIGENWPESAKPGFEVTKIGQIFTRNSDKKYTPYLVFIFARRRRLLLFLTFQWYQLSVVKWYSTRRLGERSLTEAPQLMGGSICKLPSNCNCVLRRQLDGF